VRLTDALSPLFGTSRKLTICSAYQDPSQGPFVYLDTRVALDDIVGTTANVDPQWLGVNAATAAARAADLKGAVFALSLSLVFLGTSWDGYGLINETGLQLAVKKSQTTSEPGATFTLLDSMSAVIGESSLEIDTTFSYTASISLPNISVFGVSLGSFNETVVSFSDHLDLTVKYSVTDWQNDGLDFFAKVDVVVLGLHIQDQLSLDVNIQNVSQLPGAIESFIEDKVVSYLEDLLNPVHDLELAVQKLEDEFNTAEHDMIAALSEAGHVRESTPQPLSQLSSIVLTRQTHKYRNSRTSPTR
jgi:hypothetical protein